MRKLLSFVILIILLSVLILALWKISKSRTYQFFGEIIPRSETSEKVIALTFDDGPTPQFTDEILQVLKEEDIKATFFLVGAELEKHFAEGEKIVSAEHEIGNHTFSHVRMALVTPSFVKEEIEKTDDLIRAIGFLKPIHFRPPYGKKLFALPYYLSQNNRKTITWDIEPETFPNIARNTNEITKYVLDNTQSGSVILLHVMYDSERKSMKSVQPIIKGLKEKGFRFLTVSELLSYQSGK